MDMALLQTASDANILQEALLHCIGQSELPVLVLHDADDRGYELVRQMRTWLQQQRLDPRYIVDLHGSTEQKATLRPTKVMSGELEAWLLARFVVLNISVKYLPSRTQLVQDIRKSFEHLLHEYVLENMEQQFALTSFILELDAAFSYTKMMRDAKIDTWLLSRLQQDMKAEPYHAVVNRIVEEFFEYFMKFHGSHVHHLEQTWFTRKQGGDSNT